MFVVDLLIMGASGSLTGWEPEITSWNYRHIKPRNSAARTQESSKLRKRKALRPTLRQPLQSFDEAYTAAIATFKFLVLCHYAKN